MGYIEPNVELKIKPRAVIMHTTNGTIILALCFLFLGVITYAHFQILVIVAEASPEEINSAGVFGIFRRRDPKG